MAGPRPRLVGDASARPAPGGPVPRLRDPRRSRSRSHSPGAPAARGRPRGRVVYDVIDVILESNNYDRVPAARCSPGTAGASGAGSARGRRGRHRQRPDRRPPRSRSGSPASARTVLLNCQPRWTPPEPRPDLIRAATGMPAERRVVLFLGRLGRERGLDEAAEAVLAARRRGARHARLRAVGGPAPGAGPRPALRRPPLHAAARPPGRRAGLDRLGRRVDHRRAGELAQPAPLHAEQVLGVADRRARRSCVGRDLEVMRAIVEADGLGAVADPADPTDLARGLRAMLEPGAERWRRCGRVACAVTRDRYNWEAAVGPYLRLVRGAASAATRPSADDGRPARRLIGLCGATARRTLRCAVAVIAAAFAAFSRARAPSAPRGCRRPRPDRPRRSRGRPPRSIARLQNSVTQFMSCVTSTIRLGAARTRSITRALLLARKTWSPVASTSSRSRMSGIDRGRDREAEAGAHAATSRS